MDWGFLLTIFLVFIFAVVVVRTIGEVWTRQLRLKERQLELQAVGGANATTASSDKLEQRVQVLERLATDRGQDLAREIEDLRIQREMAR